MPKPNIDHSKCDKCNNCIEMCPVQIFKDGGDKICTEKPEECLGCRACEVQCPKEAIKIED
jgi:NAD-dependent dihydropyrimidine dehydrogenase PreA subunit